MARHGASTIVTTIAVLVLSAAYALAVDILIPGKRHFVRTYGLTREYFKGKPVPAFSIPVPVPGGAADPRVGGSANSVTFLDSASGLPFTYPLTAGVWSYIPTPSPAGQYVYAGAGTPADPCVNVKIHPNLIRIICRSATAPGLPYNGFADVTLTVGTGPDYYCAEFGGTSINNVSTIMLRQNAPAPISCPYRP